MNTLKDHEVLDMIRTFGQAELHQVCEPVKPGDKLDFLYLMRRACQLTDNGVGLAANQIGILKRAIFINPNRDKYGQFLINPVIVERSEEMTSETEGCLSYPGYFGPVRRHKSIKATFYEKDMTGPFLRIFDGFASIIVQHEVDHLDGKCAVEDFWLSRTR